MARGKNYSKETERGRQYAKRMAEKYTNRTLLRLKEKVAKSTEEIEASRDLVNLYQKSCSAVTKRLQQKKKKKLRDLYPIYQKNLDFISLYCTHKQIENSALCSHPHCL